MGVAPRRESLGVCWDLPWAFPDEDEEVILDVGACLDFAVKDEMVDGKLSFLADPFWGTGRLAGASDSSSPISF